MACAPAKAFRPLRGPELMAQPDPNLTTPKYEYVKFKPISSAVCSTGSSSQQPLLAPAVSSPPPALAFVTNHEQDLGAAVRRAGTGL